MKKTIKWLLCLTLLVQVAALPVAAAALPDSVIPGGHTIGIKILAGGLLIIDTMPVETEKGEKNPAIDAGLAIGDVITTIEGEPADTTEKLAALLASNGGEAVTVRYLRGGNERSAKLTPALSAQDGKYKIGAWVRDGMAGIGTVTFYDPESGLFGALGHGVNDVDTGLLLPLGSGQALYSAVESVRMGKPGQPGELRGTFRTDKTYGSIEQNTDSGIFGFMSSPEALGEALPAPLPVARADEVKPGKAAILANVEGGGVREYEIEITRIYSGEKDDRSFMIRVTDPALLAITGGIVQGMSGSPILQNGKLAGAVTHVLINDPSRGYGIFMEHMLSEGLAAIESSITSQSGGAAA